MDGNFYRICKILNKSPLQFNIITSSVDPEDTLKAKSYDQAVITL
jgi:hypothetical protein